MAKKSENPEKCLLCGKKPHQRGLCAGHYMQAQRILRVAELAGKRAECDAAMVARGQILEAKHGPAKKPNPFAETWEAVRNSIDMTVARTLPRMAC